MVNIQNGTLLPLTSELRQHYEDLVRSMSSKALRCLAVAGKLDLGEFSDYVVISILVIRICVKDDSFLANCLILITLRLLKQI